MWRGGENGRFPENTLSKLTEALPKQFGNQKQLDFIREAKQLTYLRNFCILPLY